MSDNLSFEGKKNVFRPSKIVWPYKTPIICFPAVKYDEVSTYLIELDVRKPLVVSIPQRSEELRLYNLV